MSATRVHCDPRHDTAIHEAAHAVFHVLFGIKLETVTIIPYELDGKDFLGCVKNVLDANGNIPDMYWYRVTLYIASILAGRRAEELLGIYPEAIEESDYIGDTALLDYALAQLSTETGVQMMKNATELVSSMLGKPIIQETISMVANMLLAEGCVDGAKIEAAVLSVAGDYRLDEEFIGQHGGTVSTKI